VTRMVTVASGSSGSLHGRRLISYDFLHDLEGKQKGKEAHVKTTS
jgi:hypothetical protein